MNRNARWLTMGVHPEGRSARPGALLMSVFEQILMRYTSTLLATVTTVLIVIERHRRIANAKVELAARHVQMIEQENGHECLYKEVVRDLKLAEDLVQDTVWSRVSRTSKIIEVAHVTRRIRQMRHKHEQLESGDTTVRDATIRQEIGDHKFTELADEIRTLKVSLIDFFFVSSREPPQP